MKFGVAMIWRNQGDEVAASTEPGLGQTAAAHDVLTSADANGGRD